MITPSESLSRDVLEGVADEFRRRGYEVVVEPRGGDLPEFLSEVRPDLIARKGDEHLVIEVKRSPSDADPTQFDAIQRQIGAQRGWRFLIVASNAERPITAHAERDSLDEDSVRQRLEEARTLLDAGHPEASLVLAWTAIEALLRLLARQEGVAHIRSEPASLLRSAASEGWIGRDDFAVLNEALRVRNMVVHGFRPSPVGQLQDLGSATRALSAITDSLLSELRKSA